MDPEDHQRRNNARANYREELSRLGRMVSGLELEQQRHQAASERGSAEETRERGRGQVASGGTSTAQQKQQRVGVKTGLRPGSG